MRSALEAVDSIGGRVNRLVRTSPDGVQAGLPRRAVERIFPTVEKNRREAFDRDLRLDGAFWSLGDPKTGTNVKVDQIKAVLSAYQKVREPNIKSYTQRPTRWEDAALLKGRGINMAIEFFRAEEISWRMAASGNNSREKAWLKVSAEEAERRSNACREAVRLMAGHRSAVDHRARLRSVPQDHTNS